jgi:hypothetical protein
LKRNTLALLAVPAAAVALAACGTSVAKTSSPPSAPASATPASAPSPSATTASLAGSVGTQFTTDDGSGNKMSVTLTQTINPAQGNDSFNQAPTGHYLVAVVFKLKGISGNTQDDANNDAALIGNNGQTYSPGFETINGYTNFNSGQFTVSPGVVSIGAVVFEVPNSVKPASVQWNPNSGMNTGPPATWTTP